MNTNGPAPSRLGAIVLAVFNILVGLVGGVAGLWLAVMIGGLSVHPEDGLPALGAAVAYGLLGVAGVLLLVSGLSRPRGAVWAAVLAAVVAAAAAAMAVWKHAHRSDPKDATDLVQALVAAPVALVAAGEAAYLWWRPSSWGRSVTKPRGAPDMGREKR